MKEKNYYLTFVMLLSVWLCMPMKIVAQATVGADTQPKSFSVLELISNQMMGLRLPQMTEGERDTMTSTQFGALMTTEAKGLTIYNTTIDCMEYWDGLKWISLCEDMARVDCYTPCDCDWDGFIDCDCFNGNRPANCDPNDKDPCIPSVGTLSYTLDPTGSVAVGAPVVVTVTGSANTVNNLSKDGGKTFVLGNQITLRPEKPGANTFTVMVNNCPTQTVTVTINSTPCRIITDASLTSCGTYMFTYQTMSLTASASNALSYRWFVDDIAQADETSSTFGFRANNAGRYKVKFEAINACSRMMSNEIEIQVVTATLGVLSPITVNRADEDGNLVGTINIAHVNLGAEWDQDPCEMPGDLYQWGRIADGHQRRNLTDTEVWPNGIGIPGSSPATPADLFASTGQVAVDNVRYGKFIKNNVDAIDSFHDWQNPKNDDLWGDDYSETEIQPKSINDPCPDGWKVPTHKQLASIFKGVNSTSTTPAGAVNTWVWKDWQNYKGYLVNDILFLPAAGSRSGGSGALQDVNIDGDYWATTPNDRTSWSMEFKQGSVDMHVGSNRAAAGSVRCVQEYK